MAGAPNAAKKPSVLARLSPTAKRNLLIGGVVVGFFALAIPAFNAGPAPERRSGAPRSVDNLLTPTGARELGLSALEREVRSLRQAVNAKDQQITTLRADPNAPITATADPALVARIEELSARLELMEGQGTPAQAMPAPVSSPAPAGTLQGQGQDQYGVGRPAVATPPPAPPQIRTIAASAPAPTEATASSPAAGGRASPAKTPAVYLPAGSMIPGVLLTGLDAPTGRAASKDPVPVLVRVKHEAILPMRHRLDIRECFITLAGSGDLSSERVFLRGELMSCIAEGGGVIEVPLAVFAADETSKAGMRGTLVSKQGQVIGKALLAGFAEGTSRAFSRGSNVGYGGGGGVDLSQVGNSSAYGGVGSALDRVAEYYLSLANELFPVIEISAGRPVTLIVLKGTELALVQ
jgi:conjugal transfer pilus assembly protein TraB